MMPDNTVQHPDKFIDPCITCDETINCEGCTYYRPPPTFEDIQLDKALKDEASYEGAINAGMSEPQALYLVYGTRRV